VQKSCDWGLTLTVDSGRNAEQCRYYLGRSSDEHPRLPTVNFKPSLLSRECSIRVLLTRNVTLELVIIDYCLKSKHLAVPWRKVATFALEENKQNPTLRLARKSFKKNIKCFIGNISTADNRPGCLTLL
jgi:hypothetical protein